MREDLEKARAEIERVPVEELDKESQRNERFKKYFIRGVAVFLVLLMLSFIFLSAPVFNFIYGFVGSSRVDSNNEIFFKNSAVVSFDDDVLLFLQELYDPLGDERAVCLLGEIKEGVYFVEDYYKPLIFDRSWNSVSHAPCSDESIIMLHTHPLKRCNPSATDRVTLIRSQQANPDIIMLVMCGSRRFSAVI